MYDFGLARVLNEGEFATEDCGSLGYTAPELLSRQPYGVEVDMFSAGVIIFFVLSGYRPFNVPRATRAEVKQKIINCEYTMDQTRWNRVSSQAQVLVKSLLVPRDSEYQRRLTAPEALEHEWLREDEATRINLTRYDLNQNATYIETGVELEPVLSQHSIQSVSIAPGACSSCFTAIIVSNFILSIHRLCLVLGWTSMSETLCHRFVWSRLDSNRSIFWYRKHPSAVHHPVLFFSWIMWFNTTRIILKENADTCSSRFSRPCMPCINGISSIAVLGGNTFLFR